MTGTSEADRVALMQRAWVAEIRDRRCVHLGLHPSFEAAIVAAREREGCAAGDG